ncbi:hypothetical protein NIES2098_49060 [Calothrix sp. NIES-2098]|nr:hypothetical protein NIES2098_49060 [Calothrix sp. NIES-2098]
MSISSLRSSHSYILYIQYSINHEDITVYIFEYSIDASNVLRTFQRKKLLITENS